MYNLQKQNFMTTELTTHNAIPCSITLVEHINKMPFTQAVITDVVLKNGKTTQVLTLYNLSLNPDDIGAGVHNALANDVNVFALKNSFLGISNGEVWAEDADIRPI